MSTSLLGTNPLNALLDWIPVRSLSEEDRPAMVAHLLALSDTDRYLRFGQAAGDDQIRHYVAGISLRDGEVLGIFNRKLELLGLSHLADLAPGQAEFGVSVMPKARGRGFGQLLFDHACLHARARGVKELVIHTLTENAAMMAIAHRAGASIVRESGEATARLALPPLETGDRWLALLDDQAAEMDYRFKVGRVRVKEMLAALEAE